MQVCDSISLVYFSAPEGEEHMATQPERIATLESTIKIISRIVYVSIPLLLAWGAYITQNVVAMKQALADGGNTKLVADLQSPNSPQQLQANLNMVVAQIKSDRANNKQPNPDKVKALSRAVAQVTKKDPNLAETWQAASQLINFRIPAASIPSSPCFHERRPLDQLPSNAPTNGTAYEITLDVKDCTFDLDDTERVVKQDEDAINERMKNAGSSIAFRITFQFQRVHIIYKGGGLPSIVNMYVFRDCTFDWQLPSVPATPGQKITQQLLEAENPSNVTVSGI
jgi:hypothetical protein